MHPIPPPKGGDRDRGGSLMAMFWIEVPTAIVFVALRMYSRFKLRNTGLDDWLMVITLLLLMATAVASTFLIYHGGQRHLYYLNPTQREYANKLNWISQPFNIISLATAKMSVACLLLRLLGPSAFWRKWFLYTTIVLIFLFASLTAIFTFAQCDPPRALWEGTANVPGAKCWNPERQLGFSIFYGSYSAFVDLALALLPITLVWNLQFGMRRKIAMCSLLGLGVFASTCAAIKTATLPGLTARADLTWATHDLYVWTITENFVLIVCGSIPTLKPIYDLFQQKSRFLLSFFSRGRNGFWKSDTSTQPYSSDSARNRSHPRGVPDGHPTYFPYKPASEKKSFEQGSRRPGTSGAQEYDSDDHSLLEMGKINVVNAWEVSREQTDLGHDRRPYPLGNSVHSGAKRITGDEVV